MESGASHHSAPEYFAGFCDGYLVWSVRNDDQAAIRFSRQEDAERFIKGADPTRTHRVAEHGWG